MRLSHVPVNMYRKFAVILFSIFIGMFVLELIASVLGNPIGEFSIHGVEFETDTPIRCLLYAIVTALFVSGIVNVFLMFRIIKEKLSLQHWPVVVVVVLTLFFPLELMIGCVLVVPNMILFALKGRKKNRIYEVDFR